MATTQARFITLLSRFAPGTLKDELNPAYRPEFARPKDYDTSTPKWLDTPVTDDEVWTVCGTFDVRELATVSVKAILLANDKGFCPPGLPHAELANFSDADNIVTLQTRPGRYVQYRIKDEDETPVTFMEVLKKKYPL